MKKVMSGLFILIALGIPLSCYLAGDKAEALLLSDVARFQEYPSLRLTLRDKTRGLFSSRYVYALSLATTAQDGEQAKDTRTIILDTTLAHGPIPLAAGSFIPCLGVFTTTWTPGEDIPADARKFLADNPELLAATARTTLGFNGGGTSVISVPALHRDMLPGQGGPMVVDFNGMSARYVFDANLDNFSLALDMPAFALKSPEMNFAINELTITSESRRLRSLLYTGNARYTVRSLAVTPVKTPENAFIASNVILGFTCAARDGVLDYHLTLAGSGESVAAKRSGALDMSASLLSLDIPAMADLIEAVQSPATSPGAQSGELPAVFIKVAPQLLAKSPRFEIEKLKVTMPDGTIDASARVETSGMTSMPVETGEYAGKLKGECRLSATELLVLDAYSEFLAATSGLPKPDQATMQQARSMIDALVAQGFVSKAGEFLQSSASWDGVGTTVNGKKM